MAQIGCLGDIAFTVSSKQIQTISNIQWGGTARYGTHHRHLGNALTEFCGLEPETMSFDMELSIYLGANPMAELGKIWTYERTGAPLPLVIGDKIYGKHRWTIKSHKIKLDKTDGKGNVTWATVSVSLLEYLP